MSIQRRLAVSITLVLVLSLLIGFGLFYGHILSKIRTEMQAALAVGADTALSAIVEESGAVDPAAKLRAVVRGFDGDRHVRADLLAPDGRLLLQSRLLAPERPAPAWFYRMVGDHAPSASPALPAAFAGVGRLVLHADPHNEVAEAWSDLALTLTIMAVFFAMVLVLAALTIRAALGPLRDVCDAFLRIGAGDLSARLEPDVSRELRPLRDGFNAMAERLTAISQHNSALTEQIITLQEEERAELARDLHDDVAPFVFAVGADAAMIRQYVAKGATAEIEPRAEAIAEAVRHMQRHLKDVLRRLAPGALLDLGLAGAIENLVAFWSTRRPDLRFDVAVTDEPLEPPLDAVVFRVVQESVSNAVRHAAPQTIRIAVAVGEGFATAMVEDDGVGFAGGSPRFGFGLTGMTERVRSVGGTLAVRERTGGGASVEARLPLRRRDGLRDPGAVTWAEADA